jgi:hypothetical protein
MEKRKPIMEQLSDLKNENKDLKSKLDLILSMLELKLKEPLEDN